MFDDSADMGWSTHFLEHQNFVIIILAWIWPHRSRRLQARSRYQAFFVGGRISNAGCSAPRIRDAS